LLEETESSWGCPFGPPKDLIYCFLFKATQEHASDRTNTLPE
jgi:hypothetical protein